MPRNTRWIRQSSRNAAVGPYLHTHTCTNQIKLHLQALPEVPFTAFTNVAKSLNLRNHRADTPFLCSSDEPAEYKNRGDLESDMGVRKACRFSRTLLGPCSGLEDREFGFTNGKPCVIVKLNRIVNFHPRVNAGF